MEKNDNNIIQVSSGTDSDISGDFNSISFNNNNILDLTPIAPSTITFSLGTPPDEILRLSKEGFFWKGKLVNDDSEIYLRFKEWLDSAHLLIKGEPQNFNSIEERDNLIALMQEALKFYADKSNYRYPDFSKPGLHSGVELDGGSQAQFALDTAKKLTETNEKIQDDYDKLIMETEDFYDVGESNPIELIRVFDNTRKEEDNLTKMRRQGDENPNV